MHPTLKELYRTAVVTDNPLMVALSNIRAPKRYLRRLAYDQIFGKIPFISRSAPACAARGPVDEKMVETAVSGLRKDGIVCFPGRYADIAGRLRERYARPEEEYEPANRYERTFFGPTGSSMLTEMVLDETILSIAARYLRCQPYLRHGAALAILKPADTTVPQHGVFNGLQDWPWHIDTPNLLSFHLLMNDTSMSDTRMRYAKGSHWINRAASGIRSEELVTARNEIFECCGPAGTLYIFDNNGFHRPHAVANSMRMTFEFYFTPGNQIFSMQKMRTIVEEDKSRGKRDLQFFGDGIFDEIEVSDRFSPLQREALTKIIEKTALESRDI